ncbi:MAG: MauE/DoxX family redox-associated membrane protein, partial [Armatimonadota bacterium]
MSIREKVSVWIAVIVGLLFVAAAALKLADMPRFAAQLIAYDLMPESWAPRVAFLVAHVELLVGVALMTGAFPRQSIGIALAIVGT